MQTSRLAAFLGAIAVALSSQASADIITYRFTGNILEVPVQLNDLAYNSGTNPLVFTIVVNNAIGPDSTGPTAATYIQAVQSITVELAGTLIAAADTGLVSVITDTYNGSQPTPGKQAFQAYVQQGDFASGPVLGLTPKNLESNFQTGINQQVFASTAFPVPFPPLAFPFQVREVRLNFNSPATQPLYGYLTSVTTTSVVPVPAAAWLLGGALGLLPLVRRRA